MPRETPHPTAFPVTRWSVVVAAGGSDSGAARTALEELGRTYWYPLYADARRRGLGPADAEDAVQGFFLKLIEKATVAAADPQRGRFRAFLLVSFRHHVADERDKANALRRGGGRLVWLDTARAEDRWHDEPATALDADAEFDRRWALAALDETLHDLAEDYRARGQESLFTALRPALTGEAAPDHATNARLLGMSENALKVALHRLRQRWHDRLRQRIADTVADPAEVDDEVVRLIAAVGARL